MDQSMHIFIVEDDITLAKELQEYLMRYGFACVCANQFSNVLQTFQELQPHLILLDINLPYYDGYYWCQKIREVADVPILFISSRNDDKDKILAIAQGGDDYIEKPFHLDLLRAKLDAILRRTYQYNRNQRIPLQAHLIFDLGSQSLLFHQEEIPLTNSERRILTALLQHKGALLSREELMNVLWNTDEFISDGTLTTLISRLRTKLQPYCEDELIHTKKGIGYWIP